jgi:hypothetical protein
MIDVALLPRLCNSQVLPNHTNLILGFLQNIGSKHLPFSSLTPKQWSLTPSTIQHLKWCHLKAFLIAVVIGELGVRQIWMTFTRTSSSSKGCMRGAEDETRKHKLDGARSDAPWPAATSWVAASAWSFSNVKTPAEQSPQILMMLLGDGIFRTKYP